MLKVSGIWLNEDENGKKYMSGSVGSMRILLFKNTFKEEGSNEPDYNLYFAEQLKKKDAPKPTGVPEDDIPF